jgi:alpha-beta hydrolase superfamily lysophospholipase
MGKKVLLVHGYLEHSFNNYRLINLLLEQGCEVIAMDMPGHGLSSGERFTIENFHHYGDAVDAVLSCVGYVDFAIGHSTGCASIMDYLYRFGSQKVGHAILGAPLVRSYMFTASNLTFSLSKKFVKEIPYLSYKYSNNANYLLFKSFADLHQVRRIPLSWFGAQVAWNYEVVNCPPKYDIKVTVLQGDCDHTVDWKYNLPMIKEKFVGARTILVKGVDHGLFNESEQYQSIVFDHIIQLLNESEI